MEKAHLITDWKGTADEIAEETDFILRGIRENDFPNISEATFNKAFLNTLYDDNFIDIIKHSINRAIADM